MSQMQLICRVCGTVFSEEQARLNPYDPEEDQLQCPNCGATAIDTYPFDPDAPVEEIIEEEE